MGSSGLVLAVVILVTLGLSLIVILIFVLYKSETIRIEKKQQFQVMKASVDSEERQKSSIASNLHDSVIPLLSILRRNLEHKDGFNLRSEIEVLDQALNEIKSACLDLMPIALSTLGLFKALERYVRYMEASRPGSVILQVQPALFHLEKIESRKQIHIYRICVEILSNLIKHSGYSFLQITATLTKDSLVIEFRHDGIAVSNGEIEDLALTSNGLGLKSLKARAEILNASIDYLRQDETNVVKFELPFHEAQV